MLHRASPLLRLALLLCASSACCHAAQASDEVRVYTDERHPITVRAGEAITVIKMDEALRIQSSLSANLPADQAQAEAIVRRRLAQGGASLQARMRQAYQSVTDAWAMGVKKVPAVVVNRRYVVYGEADVSKAQQLIEQYRRAQP